MTDDEPRCTVCGAIHNMYCWHCRERGPIMYLTYNDTIQIVEDSPIEYDAKGEEGGHGQD
jgi:hypothetical protein